MKETRSHKRFAVLISTRNRLADLKLTLSNLKLLLEHDDVECIIIDDCSSDNTEDYIKRQYPQIKVFRNEVCKGYIFCRNKMLRLTTADYAISLDDDAHFISENPLKNIEDYFNKNEHCAVMAFRIFWGLQPPMDKVTSQKPERVSGFVGCGHVWRMAHWRKIQPYPEWFVFYGEEDFASYQLFKEQLEIYYFPEVLVHHRVNVKARKNMPDYTARLRNSLRAGWYLFFIFHPLKTIPKKMLYSLWMQFSKKIIKGDLRALAAVILALSDLILALPRILKCKLRLTDIEYRQYLQLPQAKIYWAPEADLAPNKQT